MRAIFCKELTLAQKKKTEIEDLIGYDTNPWYDRVSATDSVNKSRFLENLLTYAENKILIKRRMRLREKTVKDYRDNTNLKINYRNRLQFIESQMELDFKWFQPVMKADL